MVSSARLPELTARQQQVLELIASGCTNREIGERLGISLDGAKWHVSEVLARLNLDTREEAADYWRRQNGLKPRLFRLARATGAAMSWKWLGAMGLAAAAATAGFAVLLAALGGDDPPAAAPVATPTEAPTPTPTPAPVVVATPGPVDGRSLTAEPPGGTCLTTPHFTAGGFEAGADVELHRWYGLNETVLESVAVAGVGGVVTFPAIALPAECFPGLEFVYEARPPGAIPGPQWPRAVFSVDQIGSFDVTTPLLYCGGVREVGVHGSGLPPGLVMQFTIGGTSPFEHNFFGDGEALVAPDGTMTANVTIPLSCSSAHQLAVYAHDSAGQLEARWKAVFDVKPPEFSVVPASGACPADGRLAFEGHGWDAGLDLEIVLHRGMDLEQHITNVTTGASGAFAAAPALVFAVDECQPGFEFAFTVRPPGVRPGDPAASALFVADQLGRFWIEPDNGACGSIPVTIRGQGLPPDIPLRFAWGEAGPLPVHVFAQFNETATTGADGNFALDVVLPVSCDAAEPQTGVYANSPGLQARWKAVYAVTSP